jgi:signal transduction histidine kinase
MAKGVAATAGRLAAALSKHLDEMPALPPTAVAASEEGPQATMPSIGAVLAVPFAPEEGLPSGRIVVCREPGRPPFSRPEVAELTRLSSQLQVALHLAHARDDQQRLMLIEERQRIARDLHDTVIQDMIAMGMEMSAELPAPSDPHQSAVSTERLERLDDMVVSLKRAVFQLRDTTGGRSLAREVTDAVAQASRMLPAAPMVTFAGRLDLVAPDLVDDLIAVLREALSNVARHAGATRVAVSLTVTDADVTLVVDDDGIGLTGSSRSGFGVLSFTERARRHGGSVSVGPGAVVGTRVTWRCPLPL